MMYPLENRLLRREIDAGASRFTSLKGIYGDSHWVDNLDIVNELGGHHGCVNALSWSKSGRLLASGSDDTNLLIHTYQPEQSTQRFSLTTSIATGHTANIFSVKFMPHSNDNSLVSVAGDSEVRVFDVEYSSATRARSSTSSPFMVPPGGSSLTGVKYLSEGNTNARVYRSHSDRVKRIVTESSPHLFLTCSEDGEVRQWDMRLPSSAYPPPNGGRGWSARRSTHDDTNVPPPLISYKRYHLDLNTISCSASQPHYIALGGAHLHCFLHDRRMLGRDVNEESGRPASRSSLGSDLDLDDDMMGQATRCVRRFAPNGKKKMGSSSNGHVTACKISDASPNEMIASWSGDHIYSFDLIRSPDVRDHKSSESSVRNGGNFRARESRNRKRKRMQASGPQQGVAARPRRSSRSGNEDIALRVRYENGQSEDIALDTSMSGSAVEEARESMLTDSQRRSLRVAKSVVKIRKLLFSLEGSERDADTSEESGIPKRPFTQALEIAADQLTEMDGVMRSWAYPVDPLPHELSVHRELRRDRDSARRFVQAAGVLSSVLGGTLPTHKPLALAEFEHIKSSAIEGPLSDRTEIFGYEFLKAILSWLRGGLQHLHNTFRSKPGTRRVGQRYPIHEDSSLEAVHEHLLPYLLRGAGTTPIPDVDASRFEVDQNRLLFPSEIAAVRAFGNAIKIPLHTGSEHHPFLDPQIETNEIRESSSAPIRKQDLQVARRFWGFKVGRGLLMNAAERINFGVTDHAFGGLGELSAPRYSESERDQSDIDPDEEELVVDTVRVRRNALQPSTQARGSDHEDNGTRAQREPSAVEEATDSDGDAIMIMEASDDENDGDEDHDDEENDSVEDDDTDSDQGIAIENRQILWRSSSERAKLRANVEAEQPVNSHTRTYTGHCNVKTVKDVNFYGLDDEYVVSGSDSGHLFIWEKSTSKLVNILEGDGEVVNVVQGHPYEPMLAVSGIDHTIKIFSSDARAQRDARLGINLGVSANQSSGFSSLRHPAFSRRARRTRPTASPPQPENQDSNPTGQPVATWSPEEAEATREQRQSQATGPNRREVADDDIVDDELEGLRPSANGGLASRRRMHDIYQIVAQNDMERHSGQRDAFITRGMLAQLAQHMRMRRTAGGETEGEAGDGTVVLDDDCMIM